MTAKGPQTMAAGLRSLLSPRSIAIIGASSDPKKVNGRPLFNLVRDGYGGQILPVNPKYKEIAGLQCYPRVEALPCVPELGVVLVAADRVAGVIASLGEKGVKTAVVCSSGFGELGPQGKELEEKLMQVARAHGIRICGPNNLGVINAFDRMPLTFSQYADQPIVAGPIGFVSQSGAFGTAIATSARRLGLGLGYFVSTGNQPDITVVEVLDEILDDPRITVVVGYLEGLNDGRQLLRVAAKGLSLGKPIVLVKVGRRAAGSRAAMSHTGALAGDDAVFDSVIRQFGVLRARSEIQALDLAAALAGNAVAGTGGLGIITLSGGAGAMMADLAEDLGLEVPILAPGTQTKLREVLDPFAATGNPVDVTGSVVEDIRLISTSLGIVLNDPEIAVCAVWMQLLHRQSDLLCTHLIELKRTTRKPFVICWLNPPEDALRQLRQHGICVVGSTEQAIEVAAGLAEYARSGKRIDRDLPSPAPLPQSEEREQGLVSSLEAAKILADRGLPLVPTRLAATPADAVRYANEIGYPITVKIDSIDLPHKTEAGGIRLNLPDAQAVERAAHEVLFAAKQYNPGARISGVLVQKMVPSATELVLGIRRDPSFGPLIALGLGGIFVELLKDIVFARPPLTAADAQWMIDRLRGQAVLDGLRGKPPVNRSALIAALRALSSVAELHPEISELDLNPVLATSDAVVAVDWLMLRDQS